MHTHAAHRQNKSIYNATRRYIVCNCMALSYAIQCHTRVRAQYACRWFAVEHNTHRTQQLCEQFYHIVRCSCDIRVHRLYLFALHQPAPSSASTCGYRIALIYQASCNVISAWVEASHEQLCTSH